jgi:hypothetical protein
MLLWALSHRTPRPIGIRQVDTSRPTQEVVGPGRTRTRSSRRFIHGTSMRHAMRLPSSRAQTRHYPILRFTSTPSALFTPSTLASKLRLLSRSDVTRRTHTSMEMYASSHKQLHDKSADAVVQPWYLSTFAVAEQLYDALLTWESTGAIDVTSTSLDFFRQFAPGISPGTYPSKSSEFPQLTSTIKTFADGFVEIAAKYTPSDGGLAEQFNKSTGLPASAADLTWSYASVLTAAAAHAGTIPASWGAEGLIVPTTCFPNPGFQIVVTFNMQTTTQPGGTFDRTHYCTGFIPTCYDVRRKHIPHRFR